MHHNKNLYRGKKLQIENVCDDVLQSESVSSFSFCSCSSSTHTGRNTIPLGNPHSATHYYDDPGRGGRELCRKMSKRKPVTQHVSRIPIYRLPPHLPCCKLDQMQLIRSIERHTESLTAESRMQLIFFEADHYGAEFCKAQCSDH